LRSPRDTLYPQKLALTSPTSGGLSVGRVRLRTKATEFRFYEACRDIRNLPHRSVNYSCVISRSALFHAILFLCKMFIAFTINSRPTLFGAVTRYRAVCHWRLGETYYIGESCRIWTDSVIGLPCILNKTDIFGVHCLKRLLLFCPEARDRIFLRTDGELLSDYST
jgi:hypothetical protein